MIDPRQPSVPEWRCDLDALAFRPEGHSGMCVVHRRAFRSLLGRPASERECMVFYQAQRAAFEVAAHAKIVRRGLVSSVNFHLTSRDVTRSLDDPPGLL